MPAERVIFLRAGAVAFEPTKLTTATPSSCDHKMRKLDLQEAKNLGKQITNAVQWLANLYQDQRMSAPMPRQRRFPPPWSVEDTASCFIVRDGNGQALA